MLSRYCVVIFFVLAVLDYTETDIAITLEPSDDETTVTIPIMNDDVQEPQESFLVRLMALQTRVQLTQDSATVTITDDDSKYTLCLHCECYRNVSCCMALSYHPTVFLFSCHSRIVIV